MAHRRRGGYSKGDEREQREGDRGRNGGVEGGGGGGGRDGGGETTRWQSCKVLRVTPGYVMFPAFVLAIPRMVASWTLVYS